MLVLHANWSDGALWLWAESLDGYLRDTEDSGAAESALANERADGGDAFAATGTLVAEPTTARIHPFAAPALELRRTLLDAGLFESDHLGPSDAPDPMRMRLPHFAGAPVPSDRLIGVIGAEEPEEDLLIEPIAIPRVEVSGEHVIAALLRLEDQGSTTQIEFGASVKYWIMIARLVLELLVDQRFIPTLIQTRGAGLKAAWQPWLHDEATRKRLGAMIAGMPPVARAVIDAHDGQPWMILDEALRTLTDTTVRNALIADSFADAVEGREGDSDPHVMWLLGLLDRADRVQPPANRGMEMLRDVGKWIGELDDTLQHRPLRLCVRLEEPPEDELPVDSGPVSDDVRWRLSLHLTGAGGDSDSDSDSDSDLETTMIAAEQIWRDPTAASTAFGGSVRNPEELLLAELGRAARIYPVLEASLSEAEPAGVDLTTEQASAFLTEFKDLLEESGFVVIIPDWWGHSSARLGARLQLEALDLNSALAGAVERLADDAAVDPNGGAAGTSAAGQSLLGLSSLVKYRWQIAVGDQILSQDEFRSLTKPNSSLVRLHGKWLALKPDELSQADTFFDEQPHGEITLMDAIRLAHGADGRRYGLPVVGLDATGWVADLLGASTGAGTMPSLDQPAGFIGTLRPYQQIGLSWLAFLDQFGLGACLADDMGLGKTIQLIALLLAEREQLKGVATIGPTLLVVPTSVVSNWSRELARFSPTLRVHIQHGPDRPVGDQFHEAASASDVIITTYTLVSRDRETLMPVHWHRVVLDEAQYIKNPPTKQTATIRALRTSRRIALTGTPVENRLSELWSIIEFCNPGYLGQPGEFRRRFSIPIERHRDQERAEQLRRIVRPFVLRRLKTDPTVIDDLPPCVITKEYATLTAEQAALYEQTVNAMLGQVNRAEGIKRRGLVLATLVKLKQICNHPAQVGADGTVERSLGDGPAAAKAIPDESSAAIAALLSRRSGKATRLMGMLEEVLATGDKALLFTQFRRMGHLLGAMIQHDLDTEVMFLHGGTPTRKRQQMIDRFQDPDGGVPIFVLSLKAGGIGINLTAANHVFHFDRWWNPAVENQATDRAFRIGQTRKVHVHKFVCLGTLEERIDQMIEQKTELAKNIIGAGEDWLTDLTTGELRELLTLRHSAMESEG